MMPSTHGAEIKLQASVLKELSGGDEDLVMKLIDKLSPELRDIINGYKAQDNRLPSADEIIWVVGEHHNLDPHDFNRL